MKTLKLETLEIAYNEKSNEIRLLVNSYGVAATLFTLNASNLTEVMETLALPETNKVVLVAQPMKEKSLNTLWWGEEDECNDSYDAERDGFLYHLSNDNLSEYFIGDASPIALLLDSEDRAMVEMELWALGNVLDYVLG